MKKLTGGCLGFCILIGGCGTCMYVAVQVSEDARVASKEKERIAAEKEAARRAALTPEERSAEDAAKLAEEDRRREERKRSEEEWAKGRVEREKIADWQKNRDSAYDIAQDYVKKFLKYPLDASFPWFDYSVSSSKGGNVFWVTSTVEAKNAFGAQLTYPWRVCILIEDNTWRLDYCELNGEVVYLSPKATAALEGLAATLEQAEQGGNKVVPANPETESRAMREAIAVAKKAKRERNLERTAKAKQAAEQNRPTVAANTLKIGKQLKSAGKLQLAEKWYRKVIERFPETDAASEARDLLGLPAVVAAPSDALNDHRTWTDSSGKHKIDATFVKVANGKVTLRKSDGRVIEIPVASLSKEDQQFLQQDGER
ncbi:MAG: hypothetical protein IID44_01560 [Planctomycetes bacterium]|nr:hypothetical protein [Planctomycetota bacterium]